jgi:hypothetical protein
MAGLSQRGRFHHQHGRRFTEPSRKSFGFTGTARTMASTSTTRFPPRNSILSSGTYTNFDLPRQAERTHPELRCTNAFTARKILEHTGRSHVDGLIVQVTSNSAASSPALAEGGGSEHHTLARLLRLYFSMVLNFRSPRFAWGRRRASRWPTRFGFVEVVVKLFVVTRLRGGRPDGRNTALAGFNSCWVSWVSTGGCFDDQPEAAVRHQGHRAQRAGRRLGTGGRREGHDRSPYLGIDVGTGSARAGIFDASGKSLARVTRADFRDESREQSSRTSGEPVVSCPDGAAKCGRAPEDISIGFDATCSLVALMWIDRCRSASRGRRAERRHVDGSPCLDQTAESTPRSAVLRYVGGHLPEMQTPATLAEGKAGAVGNARRFFDLPDFHVPRDGSRPAPCAPLQ